MQPALKCLYSASPATLPHALSLFASMLNMLAYRLTGSKGSFAQSGNPRLSGCCLNFKPRQPTNFSFFGCRRYYLFTVWFRLLFSKQIRCATSEFCP